MAASTTLHEAEEKLSPLTRNMHRALVSVQEELEAVDWYRQRAEAADDPALREILLHNMREEIEHATMLLEWMRRNDADVNLAFSTYLFTEAPITAVEAIAEQKPPAAAPRAPKTVTAGLTVGTLKGD